MHRALFYTNMAAVGRELQDPRPIFQSWGQYATKQRRFQARTGTDPTGKPYTPLNRIYAQEKAKRWGAKPILTASGTMWRSHQWGITPGGVFWETIDAPGGKHQKGDGVPVRLVLPLELSKRDTQVLSGIVFRHTRRLLRKHSRRAGSRRAIAGGR